MRFIIHLLSATTFLYASLADALPSSQQPLLWNQRDGNHSITPQLFSELEELARIVDISYCVGVTGIAKPFLCAGRCKDFPNFELVDSWHTGPLLSDSCGYIALDHSSKQPRILLAFRGTYSIANTIADLSTIPQTYVPYVDDDGDEKPRSNQSAECPSCTVHMGFLRSWHNTRTTILPTVTELLHAHPAYSLHLVGHSLGGAVALLAGLEMSARGWHPTITTFGEPRVGNEAFVAHIDARFAAKGNYRRVTHVDDPVPLLPLTEWGYLPHANELFIAKGSLPPEIQDMRRCDGDNDDQCSAGADATLERLAMGEHEDTVEISNKWDQWLDSGTSAADHVAKVTETALKVRGLIPTRYKLWQLFFAHRDYFWRLGVCLPGGDPWDWKGSYPTPGDNL